MAVPIAAYCSIALVADKIADSLKPEYDVVKVFAGKEVAMAELPTLFSSDNAPRALIFSGPIEDADAAAISAAVTGASASARIVRFTREDLEAAGVTLPPGGIPSGPPPPGAKLPDPAVFTRMYKEKLAGL